MSPLAGGRSDVRDVTRRAIAGNVSFQDARWFLYPRGCLCLTSGDTHFPRVVACHARRAIHSARAEQHATHGILIVSGPGTDVSTLDFEDLFACKTRQAAIENALLAGGYQLGRWSSDRRSEPG